jgi:hypothetical protein
MREEDLVAPKLENMLLEFLRTCGDAGDSGTLWYAAVGGILSNSARSVLGEPGLRGLMGDAMASLPPLDRIASDKDEDLGILRKDLWDSAHDWCFVLAQVYHVALSLLPPFQLLPSRVNTSMLVSKGNAPTCR